jgi:hypothetical protein
MRSEFGVGVVIMFARTREHNYDPDPEFAK